MFLSSFLSLACVILCVTCAPQRFYASDDSYETPVRPYWLRARQPAYSPYGSSFSDEMTKLLDDLQKSILNTKVATPQFPVVGISTSTSDEDDEGTDTSVSISGTGFGGLFGTAFGGFNPKDLKNKTTVKTEVIDGHKVTIKETTYVSDNDGFKSVVHLSEVDVGESAEESDDKKSKPSTAKPDDENQAGEEETDKENEDKPKREDESTSTSDDSVPESTSTTTTEKIPDDTDESLINNNTNTSDEEADKERNRHPDIKKEESSRHPDDDVETFETFDGNSNDYFKYKTNDKVTKNKEVGKVDKSA